MSDDAPKSAYDLALEKLKRRDRERGETAPSSLTDEQKRRIGEIRRTSEARLAEREILHRSERAKLLSDPEGAEKLENLEEEYVKERRRIDEQREKAIKAVRAGEAGLRPQGGAPVRRRRGSKALKRGRSSAS